MAQYTGYGFSCLVSPRNEEVYRVKYGNLEINIGDDKNIESLKLLKGSGSDLHDVQRYIVRFEGKMREEAEESTFPHVLSP